MLYTEFSELPQDFMAILDAVGCFLESAGQFLLLLRQGERSQGNTWGLPSGRIEANESPHEAMLRELREETGYHAAHSSCEFVRRVYVRYKGRYDFIYYIFYVHLETRPEISIRRDEHQDFQWMSPKEALIMHQTCGRPNLVEDLDRCIELFYGS